jgi:hypothetical protein
MPLRQRGVSRDPDESKGLLSALLARYGFPPGSEAARLFEGYLALLKRWGRRINLVGSLEWGVLGPLFEEGLWCARFYPDGAACHLDIGSGAGFPALPLCFALPRLRLELLESRNRRAAFLETVAAELCPGRAVVREARLSDWLGARREPGEWEVVSWKGLTLSSADFGRLCEWSRPGVQLWVFHGRELPLEDPEDVRRLRLCRRESCPAKAGWQLSVYER